MEFIVQEMISIVLQFILFIPFYFIYKHDCKTIGKKRLAVGLGERFSSWCIYCPLWSIPILVHIR